MKHARLTDKNWNSIIAGVSLLNGVRTPGQKKGYQKKSARSTAEMFYNSLSTPSLRMQCQLFGLNYDSFDSVEEAVEALVGKHVEMNVG